VQCDGPNAAANALLCPVTCSTGCASAGTFSPPALNISRAIVLKVAEAAELVETELGETKYSKTKLTETKYSKTKLTETKLSETKLSETKLSGGIPDYGSAMYSNLASVVVISLQDAPTQELLVGTNFKVSVCSLSNTNHPPPSCASSCDGIDMPAIEQECPVLNLTKGVPTFGGQKATKCTACHACNTADDSQQNQGIAAGGRRSSTCDGPCAAINMTVIEQECPISAAGNGSVVFGGQKATDCEACFACQATPVPNCVDVAPVVVPSETEIFLGLDREVGCQDKIKLTFSTTNTAEPPTETTIDVVNGAGTTHVKGSLYLDPLSFSQNASTIDMFKAAIVSATGNLVSADRVHIDRYDFTGSVVSYSISYCTPADPAGTASLQQELTTIAKTLNEGITTGDTTSRTPEGVQANWPHMPIFMVRTYDTIPTTALEAAIQAIQ